MEASPISAVPLLVILGVLVYTLIVGERAHSSKGAISILGVAATLLGLVTGWFLQRFVPLNRGVDDWLNYRSLRLEVGILFFIVSAITFLGVTLIRRDLDGRSKTDSGARKASALACLLVLAVSLPVRAQLAAFLAALLSRTGL
jgi:hypothetical protein